MRTLLAAAVLVGAVVGTATATGAGPSAAAAAPGSYRGTTSQGYVLTFRVLPGGRSIRPFAATIRVRCNGVPTERAFLPPGTTSFNGVSFARRASDGKGGVYTFNGSFSGGSGGGTISLGSTRIVFNGFEVCVTVGSVSWRARRVGA